MPSGGRLGNGQGGFFALRAHPAHESRVIEAGSRLECPHVDDGSKQRTARIRHGSGPQEGLSRAMTLQAPEDPERGRVTRPPAGQYEAMRRRAERLRWRIIPARPFEPREVRLWFPMTLVLILLSPLLLLAMGIVVFLPRPFRVNPAYLVLTIGRVLTAISDAQVDVESPRSRVHIKLF